MWAQKSLPKWQNWWINCWVNVFDMLGLVFGTPKKGYICFLFILLNSYECHFFPNGYSSAIRPRYQTHFLPTTYRVEQQHKIHIGWNPSAKCSKWIQHLHFTWTNIAFSRQCDDIDQVRCLPLAHQSITANGILSEILENICKENKFHLIKGTIKTSINACEKKASEKYSTELFQCLPIYMCMIYAYDVCHIH